MASTYTREVELDRIKGYRTHILRHHTDQTLIDTYWYIVLYQLGRVVDQPELEDNPLVALILDPLLATFDDDAVEAAIEFTCAVTDDLAERGYTECTGCGTYGNRHLVDCAPTA
jgi:hypothetical protein